MLQHFELQWNQWIRCRTVSHHIHAIVFYRNTNFVLAFLFFHVLSVTPIVNVVQTFLNEDVLYNAIIDLPEKMNFFSSIRAVVFHAKFPALQGTTNHFHRKIALLNAKKLLLLTRCIYSSIRWETDGPSEHEWATDWWFIRHQCALVGWNDILEIGDHVMRQAISTQQQYSDRWACILSEGLQWCQSRWTGRHADQLLQATLFGRHIHKQRQNNVELHKANHSRENPVQPGQCSHRTNYKKCTDYFLNYNAFNQPG